MNFFIFPFFFSLFLSLFLISIFLFVWRKYSFFLTEREDPGRDHKKNIPRWGGSIVGVVFLLTIFLDPFLEKTPDICGLLFGCLGMFFLGVRDDLRSLDWKWQLVFQGMVIFLVVYFFDARILDLPNPLGGRIFFGEGVISVFLGGLVTFVWFLVVMNALNWSDGIDGVASGTVLLAALALLLVSMRPEVFQPPVAILASALLGSYLGLFLFNMYPAKIFSGTTGVFIAGFSIAYISIFAGMKMATAFLVLGVPILDAFWVLWKRFRSGESLAHPDKKHLHFQLLNSGWGERKVSFSLLGVIAFATGATFLFGTTGKIFSILILVSVFFILIRVGEKNTLSQ